ncbi:hypothetical protein D3C74_323430 [compost metagenome]
MMLVSFATTAASAPSRRTVFSGIDPVVPLAMIPPSVSVDFVEVKTNLNPVMVFRSKLSGNTGGALGLAVSRT